MTIFLSIILHCLIFPRENIEGYLLPEIYQDVIIGGNVVRFGERSCADRYAAIRSVLQTLPKNFKALDIGASQGYFSFMMAADYQARCTMIEGGYSVTDFSWPTSRLLKILCQKNPQLKGLVLLEKQVFSEDLRSLASLEKFDIVLAFSVIHHMKKCAEEDNAVYAKVIDAILSLAPVVLIENPINTGQHTEFIRKLLKERGGSVLYSSNRGTLTYEIYVFNRVKSQILESLCEDLSLKTYKRFHGVYKSEK